MDPITVLLGVFGLAFGGYTTFLRFTNPAKLGKLGPMRDRFGHGPGTVIHIAGYSVAPIAFGIAMLFAGVRGVSVL